MTIMNNLLGGFLMVLGIETVVMVSNVLTSYVGRSGETLQEMIDSRVGTGNGNGV